MRWTLVFLGFVVFGTTIDACTFCAGGFANRQSVRERAANASIVVHGILIQSRVAPNGVGGETDLAIATHFKTDKAFGTPKQLTIPQYLPLVGDTPRDYLVFANLLKGQPDIVSGLSWPSNASAYIRESLALPANEAAQRLAFYFKHLDSPIDAVSGDAFLEFAKANDADITQAAKQKSFDVAKLRTWLADPATPTDRLGVYWLMLGLAGDKTDVERFRTRLSKLDKDTSMIGGLLAGLTTLDADAGWAEIGSIITDTRRGFDQRLAAMGTIRYLQVTHPAESKPKFLPIAKTLLAKSDFADMVAEQLRQWQWWDLTADVLAPFDQATHKAPIIRQAIVRYALTCPDETCKVFIQNVSAKDADLVSRVRSNLSATQSGRTPPRR